MPACRVVRHLNARYSDGLQPAVIWGMVCLQENGVPAGISANNDATRYLQDNGLRVFTVPEAASILFANGACFEVH